MADQNDPAQAKPAGEKKPRSPIERAVVWGGILIMVIVIGVEYRAKSAFESNFKKLDDALGEAVTTGKPLVEADVKRIVTGYSDHQSSTAGPNKLAASRIDVFTYKGLLQTRVFRVSYGIEGADGNPPEVLRIDKEGASYSDGGQKKEAPAPTPKSTPEEEPAVNKDDASPTEEDTKATDKAE